ncbi:sensor histidine kinase [Jeotgalibaca porci]|uniref:sensor histidine kinase n=1 Tax=Jeotgalibaca porci TaxID=1868793 RepID=UPI0035A197E6
MKRFFQHLYDAHVWIISQFILTAFFIFLAWLAYPETFTVLILVMVLMSGLLLLVPIGYLMRKEKVVQKAFRIFLAEPELENEQYLARFVSKSNSKLIQQLGETLREKEDRLTQQNLEVSDYETYIEEWVHEIKKPLSLLTLILDNRSDEMSALVRQRTTHARNEIQNDVEKILYFSRLRTVHRDYLFERVALRAVFEEAIAENASLIAESDLTISIEGNDISVTSDRRSLLFILAQLIHNSAKYAGKGAHLSVRIEEKEAIIVTFHDNGPGISARDLPFIFDKGFTGGRAKATGMGLYLAQRIATDLNIQLVAETEEGLRISLIIPKAS